MSESRHCEHFLATDGQWYLILGDFEYAWDEHDCTTYGPFKTEEALDKYLRDNFTNPGCGSCDDSGTIDPPKEVTSPRRANTISLGGWARYR
jgi:hypothetical protein